MQKYLCDPLLVNFTLNMDV